MGRDYTSLATWETTTDGDLVAAGNGEVLDCFDDKASFDEKVTLGGATTDTAKYRVVRPAAGEGHDGTPNNGFFVKLTSGGYVFNITEDNSRVHDVIAQLDIDTTAAWRAFRCLNDNTGFVGCIAWDIVDAGTGVPTQFAISNATGGTSFTVLCLATGGVATVNGGFRLGGAAGTALAYNCVAHDTAGNGFFAGGGGATEISKNNLSSNVGQSDFSGTFSTLDSNASADATASGTGARTSQTFTFADDTSDDLHITSGDAGARNFGVDLSADGTFAFDDDIDGALWDVWDIGFNEPQPAAGTTPIITAGAAFDAAKNVNFRFFDVSITDPGGGDQVFVLACTSGILTIVTPGPVIVTNNGTASVSATGTPTELNTMFALGVDYLQAGEVNDSVTLDSDNQDPTSAAQKTMAVTMYRYEASGPIMGDVIGLLALLEGKHTQIENVSMTMKSIDDLGNTDTDVAVVAVNPLITQTLDAPYEGRGLATVTGVLPWENRGFVPLLASSPYEGLQTVPRTGVMPWEAKEEGLVFLTAIFPMEWGTRLLDPVTLPYEGGANVAVVALSPHETQKPLDLTASLPLEGQGFFVRVALHPWESAGAVLANVERMPWEARAFIGPFAHVLPYETLGPVAQPTSTLPLEWRGQSMQSQVFLYEGRGIVLQERVFPLEAQGRETQIAVMPWESIYPLSQARMLPIEGQRLQMFTVVGP